MAPGILAGLRGAERQPRLEATNRLPPSDTTRTQITPQPFSPTKPMANTSFQELINGDTPVLIDFYATWCGPCKAYSPILQQLKEDMGDSMRLIKIDVDRNPEITQKLGVQSMPTTMIFQQGELKFRAAGVQSPQTLKNELAKLS